ncbi:MAG: cytochrome C oxidase subunit IV family protein [Vicinamibacterales bacterium]|jgi:caa(3)-type oxidase subunit IV|tara:strand:+ start:403 stop:777 length:375 start_codon:yes stop_codon:yes gene_type:complete
MSDHVQHHIAVYKKVAASLAVLTTLTVGVSYLDVAVPLAVTIALVIAATKGSLVVSFFMHLLEEKKPVPLSRGGIGLIIGSLLVTALFFLVIIFIPLMGHSDKVGTYFSLPNANAPTVETPAAH